MDLDHEPLTYRCAGRDFPLANAAGDFHKSTFARVAWDNRVR
jgi:hypothetical protein